MNICDEASEIMAGFENSGTRLVTWTHHLGFPSQSNNSWDWSRKKPFISWLTHDLVITSIWSVDTISIIGTLKVDTLNIMANLWAQICDESTRLDPRSLRRDRFDFTWARHGHCAAWNHCFPHGLQLAILILTALHRTNRPHESVISNTQICKFIKLTYSKLPNQQHTKSSDKKLMAALKLMTSHMSAMANNAKACCHWQAFSQQVMATLKVMVVGCSMASSRASNMASVSCHRCSFS